MLWSYSNMVCINDLNFIYTYYTYIYFTYQVLLTYNLCIFLNELDF